MSRSAALGLGAELVVSTAPPHATDLSERGGEAMLKVVQRRLRHSTPAITASTDLDVTPAVDMRVTEGLEERIAAAVDAVSPEDSPLIRRQVIPLTERCARRTRI